MDSYSGIRLRKETAERLRTESAKMTVTTGQRWTMDRLINALLDGAPSLQPKRQKVRAAR